jgi:hypothetical protein
MNLFVIHVADIGEQEIAFTYRGYRKGTQYMLPIISSSYAKPTFMTEL